MGAGISIFVGKAGDIPIVIVQVGMEDGSEPKAYTLSISEAQQLGTSILISCGIAIERQKE